MTDQRVAKKAIVLLSGGLDSTLAVQLLLDQGVEVLALNFTSPFCTCSPKKEGGCHLASQVAVDLGVPIRVLAKGKDYLELVRNPKHGHGKGMNPCIDCRIYMLRKARELLSEEGAGFVVTGEVLGQRPMSQHKRALRVVEQESGLEGLLLRPLSAHLLEPTIPELQGVVDREGLLAFQGRTRRPQLALARSKGMDLFGCPGGGCLLTDRVIAARIRDLFDHREEFELEDVRLLLLGRHYRLNERLKAIVGRNEAECLRLGRAPERYHRLELLGVTGPLMLFDGTPTPEELRQLGGLLRFHCKKAPAGVVAQHMTGATVSEIPVGEPATLDQVEGWRVGPTG